MDHKRKHLVALCGIWLILSSRRTHQSGPLGELFDHGVDAVNTSLECLIFAASQNLGMGWKTVLTLFGGMPYIPRLLVNINELT